MKILIPPHHSKPVVSQPNHLSKGNTNWVQIETIHGFSALLADSDVVILPTVASFGVWEADMTIVINSFLKEGDTYLDLGGNVGMDAI